MYTALQLFSLVISIFQCLGPVGTDDDHCFSNQELFQGERYYQLNPDYPNPYPPSTSCRWEIIVPPGTITTLDCLFMLPYSKGCEKDRVVLEYEGMKSNYCGHVNVTKQIRTKKLIFEVFSTKDFPGGKFDCIVVANESPKLCNCGLKEKTRVNKFSSLALLVISDTKEALCGASIISEWYALTGAYCHVRHNITKLGLLVGEHDTAEKKVNATTLYPLIDFIQHPFYNNSTGQNDIAVLKTKKKIDFDNKIGPICLPFKYATYDFSEKMVTIFGWGFKVFYGLMFRGNESKSTALQEVEAHVVSNDKCNVTLPRDIIAPLQTQVNTPQGNVSCGGYSGMPIVFQDPASGRSVLIGIMPSLYIGCGTLRSVLSTRVVPYLKWIISVTDISDCESY